MNRLVCGNLMLIMFFFTIFNCSVIAKDEQIKVEGKTNHFQYDKQKKSDRVITIPKNNHKSIENEIKIQDFGDQTNKVNAVGKERVIDDMWGEGKERVPGDIWDTGPPPPRVPGDIWDPPPPPPKE